MYAALVCPSESKANIFSIDASEAEKQPGIFKVITSKDVTGTNRISPTEEILHDRSVSGPGDAIAAVLAFTKAAASEAACKVKATVEASDGKAAKSEKCCCGCQPSVAFAYVNEKGKMVIHSPRSGLNASAIEDGIGIPRGQLTIVNIPGSDASAAGSGSSIEGIAAAAALAAGKPVYVEAGVRKV